MKFYIDKIILWLKNGNKRILQFENDKVNVVTGNSKTGKTAILEIIDYCLLGSHSNISAEHIGENILWYGLRIYINGKYYTIARGEYKEKLSNDYYFSSNGEIPNIPEDSILENELRTIIESEFSIDPMVTFPFGGKYISKNAKISFRYFLMFNTLSGDVINHSKNYFDKMEIDRYREALPRIFDLALGITTIKDIVIKDHIEKIEREIRKIELEKEKIQNRETYRDRDLSLIIKKAKELKIISSDISDKNECVELLKNIFETGILPEINTAENNEIEALLIEKQKIEIQIRKLKKFKRRYNEYKNEIKKEAEALSPLSYILNNFSQNISNDEYYKFLQNLESELIKIKIEIKDKKPFEYDVEEKIIELQKKLESINKQIEIIPQIDDTIKNSNQRLISIGEIKSEFYNLINQTFNVEKLDIELETREEQKNDLMSNYNSPDERRLSIINALNDYIQNYIKVSENALDEYGKYLADFDYSKKVLRLRRSKSTITANITSSSDHLFMHLCLFLGMHQLIIDNHVPYIIPFMIIDQPSRPYFNNSNFDFNKSKESLKSKDDWTKVKEIFSLIDIFMENIKVDGNHFQIILLEHVSDEAWQQCKNINLVEVFDGTENALIPLNEKL